MEHIIGSLLAGLFSIFKDLLIKYLDKDTNDKLKQREELLEQVESLKDYLTFYTSIVQDYRTSSNELLNRYKYLADQVIRISKISNNYEDTIKRKFNK